MTSSYDPKSLKATNKDATTHDGDQDSPPPDDVWSAAESDDDRDAESVGEKKRKRPMSVSCEVCKQRKVRCDRGQPVCGWCSRNNHVCEYKERKKPGLRAGYGKELESRLERLEDITRQQGRLLDTFITARQPTALDTSQANLATSPLDTAATVTQQSPNDSSHTASHRGPSISQLSPGGDIVPTYAQSQPGSTPRRGGVNSYVIPADPARNGLPAHVATPLQAPNGPEYFNASPTFSTSIHHDGSSILADPSSDFPPYDLLYALVDLYFRHINTWCPILHRKSTLDSLFGSSPLDDSDRIILHAIVATSLRYSIDPRLTGETRQRYHDMSKQKVLLYGMENSNVKSLQALVILAIDITGTSNGPPGWNLLALITRSVVQLGLAVEATSSLVSPNLLSIYTLRAIVLPEPETWIEDESRRRLFWMIYLLDRYGTIATAFDFALNDKEIDRKLPCRDDLFSRNQPVETRWFGSNERTDHTADRPENLGSFSFYCEVLGILSSVHQFLKRPVDITALEDVERWQRDYRDLDSKLNLWKYGLPIEFGNGARLFQAGANKQITCMWVMLHVTYHTVVIRLHSSAAYPTTRSPIFTPSYSAMMRCLSAVDAIVDLTKFVTENNMLDKLGPPFAFSLWVCSRLLLVHGSTVDHRVKSEIFLFVNTLSQMGQYWQVAKRYTQLLARVLDEYQQTQMERTASINSSDVNETPASMHILADMRRTAFDLDFLISHQPKLPIRNSVNPDSAPNRSPYPSAMANATTSNIIQNPPSTSRTPLPNELEYLDVFDFFNMPRLPTFGLDTGIHNNTNNGHGLYENRGGGGGAAGGSHNIMDFMVPNPESDWFLKS